jgi:hypothetical protein
VQLYLTKTEITFLYWWLICLQQNHKIMANGYGLLGIDPVHNRLS